MSEDLGGPNVAGVFIDLWDADGLAPLVGPHLLCEICEESGKLVARTGLPIPVDLQPYVKHYYGRGAVSRAQF